MRKTKVLVATAACGAAFAYFLDPVAGERRRNTVVRAVERRRADIDHLQASIDRVVDAITPSDSESTPVEHTKEIVEEEVA